MDIVRGDNGYLQIIVNVKENIMYIYSAFQSFFTMLYVSYNFNHASYKGQDFYQTNSRLTSGGILYTKQWVNGCRHGCKEQYSCLRQNGTPGCGHHSRLMVSRMNLILASKTILSPSKSLAKCWRVCAES